MDDEIRLSPPPAKPFLGGKCAPSQGSGALDIGIHRRTLPLYAGPPGHALDLRQSTCSTTPGSISILWIATSGSFPARALVAARSGRSLAGPAAANDTGATPVPVRAVDEGKGLCVGGWPARGANTCGVRIAAFRPDYLMGYTSALATVADNLLRADLRLSVPLRAVVTIAETLSPDRRRVIEGILPRSDHQSLRASRIRSLERPTCSLSGAQFHVNTELVVAEIPSPRRLPGAARRDRTRRHD